MQIGGAATDLAKNARARAARNGAEKGGKFAARGTGRISPTPGLLFFFFPPRFAEDAGTRTRTPGLPGMCLEGLFLGFG